MRRLTLVGLVALVVPALAYAGVTVTDGNNTLQIKAKFEPAKASKARGPLRPVEAKYDYSAGTTNDKRLANVRSYRVYLGGAKFDFDSFPKCDESDLGERGASACPKGSKVGSGTAVAEVHPPDDKQSKSDLAVDVLVFNGKLETGREPNTTLPEPRDGLLIYTKVGETNLALPFWAERRNRGVGLYNPEQAPETDPLYSIKEIHLTLPRKTRMRDGKRIPFLGNPRKCAGGWTVTTTQDRYQGGELTATHRVRCTKA